MAKVLLLTNSQGASAEVLPALGLLQHTCKVMPLEASVLVDTPLMDIVFIDAESHLELVRELDIRSTPTTLFINKDGVEVGRAAGTPKREQVLAALSNIR